jgi:hypothetical protein
LQSENRETPMYANLTDVSIGGCFVETSNILSPGTNLKISFSMDDGTLTAEGVVARIDPGSGVAVQFKETNREGREKMIKIIEYVQKSSTFFNNRYLEGLLKR